MKAKEYAARYMGNPDTLQDIAKQFVEEIETLGRARHIKTDASFISVLNELSNKWRAFARIAGDGLRPDGFERIVEALYPETYQAWKRYDVHTRQ